MKTLSADDVSDEEAKKQSLIASYWTELSRLRGLENLWLGAQNRIMALQMRLTQESKASLDIQKEIHRQMKKVNALVPDATVWH